MKEAILKYNIKDIFIYRHSSIYGKRENKRLIEHFGMLYFSFFTIFLKENLAKCRPIIDMNLAKAMILGIHL